MKNRKLLAVAGLIGVALAVWLAAGKEDGPAARRDGAAEGARIRGDEISIGPSALRTADLRTAPARGGSVPVTLALTGVVKPALDRFAYVTPRISGAVRSIERDVGDAVSAGDSLCAIESVELGEARAAYVSALSDRRLAERNYERWKLLFEKGLKTKNELWSAENELIRARLALDAALAKLKTLGVGAGEIDEYRKRGGESVTNVYVVRSPVDGSIFQREVAVGQSVGPTDRLFLVANLSEVWVEAALYEKDLGAVRPGMRAAVSAVAYPGESYSGRVTNVGLEVEEMTRTVPLRITVENVPVPGSGEPFALRPGMFVTAKLEAHRGPGGVVVPVGALQRLDGDTVVFVGRVEGASFERRKVVVAARDGEMAEITKGLAEGEPVVVENSYVLKSEFEKAESGKEDE